MHVLMSIGTLERETKGEMLYRAILLSSTLNLIIVHIIASYLLGKNSSELGWFRVVQLNPPSLMMFIT